MTAEFCRRAERGLGVAIREGQANGTIETRSDVARRGTMVRERNQGRISDDDLNHFMNEVDTKQKLADLVDTQELSNNGCGIYQMTDNVTDEQFDQAIAEAKAEGNLSRANVARKCKAKSKPVIDAEGTVAILAAILAGTPRLPGAACRDHVGLYDAAADGDRDAAQQAIEICRRCPVLETCARWISDTHPRRPPPGVWAAQYQPPTTSRRKATNDRP